MLPGDDSQRQFLVQHSITTLLRHCFEWLQHCYNIAMMCCAWNCHYESCGVMSPLRRTWTRDNNFLFSFSELRACLHGGVGPQVSEVTCGGSPRLTCKRHHIKMRDYMHRRVTLPKRVTSPTLGPPTPCKQALTIVFSINSRKTRQFLTNWMKWNKCKEVWSSANSLLSDVFDAVAVMVSWAPHFPLNTSLRVRQHGI